MRIRCSSTSSVVKTTPSWTIVTLSCSTSLKRRFQSCRVYKIVWRRVVTKSLRFCHLKPLLKSLHWTLFVTESNLNCVARPTKLWPVDNQYIRNIFQPKGADTSFQRSRSAACSTGQNLARQLDLFCWCVGSWRRSVNVAFIPGFSDARGCGRPPRSRTLVTGAQIAMCAALVFFPHFRRYTRGLRTCRSSLSLSQLRRAVRGRLCFAVAVC